MVLKLFLLLSLLLLFSTAAYSQRRQPILSTSYYQKKCPRFEQIMQDATTNKQITSPTTAAATLRLFFHDCFMGGCDASVLISSTPFNKAERDADINLSLPGDGFDVVVRAKTAVELACPGVVSCADILAVAARNLVLMMGGPYYTVKLGRKDSLISKASYVEGNLPRPTMPMTQIIQIFTSRGFSIQEMVALSGAHTIGFSHCKEFSSILYNYSRNAQSDPAYNPRFAQALRNACADCNKNPTLSVFNDVMSPNKFDNMYYQNLQKGLGILSSDHTLNSDPRTKGYVELYSKNQNAFFVAFARAMEKLSVYGVKTGRKGEIRRRCDAFNNR
ncbi:peroxidase 31-like [Olea europaea var. sylvestris]|uniref:peroxidase 31-like n=1 Tax=Olea europaea var. sylvestris TaxID=158386 RepID=UPI000C1CD840|nr:peroxidase 31-like [Olea europaea var. sylvestris]